MKYAVWSGDGRRPLHLGTRRAAAIEAAAAAKADGKKDVTVYDQDGGVFAPNGRATYCPVCFRENGQHYPGPPFCERDRV